MFIEIILIALPLAIAAVLICPRVRTAVINTVLSIVILLFICALFVGWTR